MTKQKHLILSSCGTSILTNNADAELRRLLISHANIRHAEECSKPERELIEQHIQTRQQALLAANDQTLATMSAEMNALLRFYSDSGTVKHSADMHVLLHTDTWLGQQAGDMLRALLEQRGLSVDMPVVKDLHTKDVASFQLALSELAKWSADYLSDYRDHGYKVIFNLTGGFKSIQGFLQALAMLYADESIYIFETGQDLLRLPRLPLRLDAEQVVRDNVQLLRQLDSNLATHTQALTQLPETLLWHLDDNVCLSPWGEVVWQNYKKSIYAEKLLPPPSEQVRFTDRFKQSVSQLNAERLVLLNQQIDKLARYLQSNQQERLASLDVKPVRHAKEHTHEFDAWHDLDAKRVFGYLDNNTFTCDYLGDGLGH